MLKLKRVEIHGFKSFYDRTEMKFNGSGIAAVVGPNGCGKSNLSDAISWVLGEQSAKSLRGARMEDVIFAGTRDKKALGMASVTMTLIPDERKLGLIAAALPVERTESEEDSDEQSSKSAAVDDPPSAKLMVSQGTAAGHSAERVSERTGEITITRRLFRSGESEYLINGKQARLRDIQDLFLGTGLGPESYAIIEQGRIGQILSNRPQDRRGVIEEAAGITRFKTRKRLAEAKLESAKQNLARVFDILEEVTRQANSLKRQAAKTRRYEELKGEATGYLRQLLAAKFQQLERESARLAIELNLASAELDNAQAAIAGRESEQTSVLEALYAGEQELTAARQELSDLQVAAERARAQLEYQQKQIEQITGRLEAGELETERLERQQAEQAREHEQQQALCETLDGEYDQARIELEAKAAERQQRQDRLKEQERRLEEARQRVLRQLGESATLKNRITQVDAQLATAERDAARARSEEQQSANDRQRIEQSRAQLSEQLAARQTQLISLSDQRKSVEQELHGQRGRFDETRQTLERLRSEYSRVKARKDSLEEVIQHRSYSTETVKRLFTAVERAATAGSEQPRFAPVGVLADFLEVDPQFEKAAEEFLHDELEFVVVSDWEDAERGMELVRGELSGRATFLAEKGSAGESSLEMGEGHGPLDGAEPAAGTGTLTRLTDALRFTNGLSGLTQRLVPRIANCYLTADRALARQLAEQFPHCWFLTNDGVNYHGRALSGGKKTGAGPLALKRELREISTLEKSKQGEMAAAQEALGSLEKSLAQLGEQLEQLRSQQQLQEKDVLALDHESRKLAEELQRVQARLSAARLELERLARDGVKLEENAARDRQALTACEAERTAHEQALEEAREELQTLQRDAAQAGEEHAGLRANLASLEERRRSVAASRARLEAQLREFTQRRENLNREAERLQGEREQLSISNLQLAEQGEERSALLAAAEAAVVAFAAREETLKATLAAAEEVLKRLRVDAQAGQERRSELQVALARAESDLEHLAETCRKELDTSLSELVEGVDTALDEEALRTIDGKYLEVRRKIEALGPVNPQALEEFEEAQQRQDFLQAQRQDLLDSIRDTEKAIHEIDSESQKRFAEAFEAINANFRVMFQVLFGGGVGEMRLSGDENLAESGIDIVASPPGKKLQSVLLLSGGEKSLTAMALLMAIFQYTPSPFCILDEVDAPLDEPNIERLTRLLQEMAGQTQFIVITHAKRTMEAAQSLYGVTMQEPGVSKLVSVKFKAGAVNGLAKTKKAAVEEELETVSV